MNLIRNFFVKLNTISQTYEYAFKFFKGLPVIITIIISIFTLNQTIATRNSEYKPFLVPLKTETANFVVTWDSHNIDEAPSITGSMPPIKFVNVGNGN